MQDHEEEGIKLGDPEGAPQGAPQGAPKMAHRRLQQTGLIFSWSGKLLRGPFKGLTRLLKKADQTTQKLRAAVKARSRHSCLNPAWESPLVFPLNKALNNDREFLTKAF